MNIDIYYETVQEKEGKFCTIETTAGVYYGVFLGTAKPGDDLLMVIRPSGETRDLLTNLATEDGTSCKDKIGVLVESIVNIEFKL